jgi:hypothetical protein
MHVGPNTWFRRSVFQLPRQVFIIINNNLTTLEITLHLDNFATWGMGIFFANFHPDQYGRKKTFYLLVFSENFWLLLLVFPFLPNACSSTAHLCLLTIQLFYSLRQVVVSKDSFFDSHPPLDKSQNWWLVMLVRECSIASRFCCRGCTHAVPVFELWSAWQTIWLDTVVKICNSGTPKLGHFVQQFNKDVLCKYRYFWDAPLPV